MLLSYKYSIEYKNVNIIYTLDSKIYTWTTEGLFRDTELFFDINLKYFYIVLDNTYYYSINNNYLSDFYLINIENNLLKISAIK